MSKSKTKWTRIYFETFPNAELGIPRGPRGPLYDAALRPKAHGPTRYVNDSNIPYEGA
jgi:hypothetical protein